MHLLLLYVLYLIFICKKNIDELFSIDKSLVYTPDPDMSGAGVAAPMFQGGFMLLKVRFEAPSLILPRLTAHNALHFVVPSSYIKFSNNILCV